MPHCKASQQGITTNTMQNEIFSSNLLKPCLNFLLLLHTASAMWCLKMCNKFSIFIRANIGYVCYCSQSNIVDSNTLSCLSVWRWWPDWYHANWRAANVWKDLCDKITFIVTATNRWPGFRPRFIYAVYIQFIWKDFCHKNTSATEPCLPLSALQVLTRF